MKARRILLVLLQLIVAKAGSETCSKEGFWCQDSKVFVDFSGEETLEDLLIWLRSTALSHSMTAGSCPYDKELAPPDPKDSLKVVLSPVECGNPELQTGNDLLFCTELKRCLHCYEMLNYLGLLYILWDMIIRKSRMIACKSKFTIINITDLLSIYMKCIYTYRMAKES